MLEKEKKAWLELYDVAEEIQKLEPWKYLWDADLLTYYSHEYDDMFYCCVMGKGGMHRGIAIYKGEQVHTFFNLMENTYPIPVLLNYQECLKLNYTNRDEIIPSNKKLIKDLGLKFRGTWIHFENFEKGYDLFTLNSFGR